MKSKCEEAKGRLLEVRGRSAALLCLRATACHRCVCVCVQATEHSEKLDKELKSLEEMEEQADSR